MIPHGGHNGASIWEEQVTGCDGFLPGHLYSTYLFSGYAHQIALEDAQEDRLPEVNASPTPSPSSSSLLFLLSASSLSLPTNLNVLINMVPLQGLHTVTEICFGSMGEFSFPF